MQKLALRLFLTLALLGLVLRGASACTTAYALGNLCTDHCSEAGEVLDDGTTCYCDPEKYIVHPEKMVCMKKLPLGFYPSLQSVANTLAATANLEHTLAEPCSSTCRTCQISEDFTTGNPDYCTSCDLDSLPILDLGDFAMSNPPTCVAEPPAQRAMISVQNGRILGVFAIADDMYGGAMLDGSRIAEAWEDPEDEYYTNSDENPDGLFGGCEEDDDECLPPPICDANSTSTDDCIPMADMTGGWGGNSSSSGGFGSGAPLFGSGGNSTTGSGNSTSGSGNSTTGSGMPGNGTDFDEFGIIDGDFSSGFDDSGNYTGNPEDELGDLTDEEIHRLVRGYIAEEHLPKAIDIVNEYGILGLGLEKMFEDECSLSIGENRRPRNMHPGIMYIALPCPENCDECHVTRFGSLVCTAPATGYKVQDGEVVDACDATGYLEEGDHCINCERSPRGGVGCQTCEIQADASSATGEDVLQCTQCDTAMGYTLTDVVDPNDTTSVLYQRCEPAVECFEGQYFDVNMCGDCPVRCDMCTFGDSCDMCADEYLAHLNTNGNVECIPEETGCPDGFYENHQAKCLPCDDACTTCAGPAADHCTSCPAGEVLRPHQKLRVDRLNQENALGFEMGDFEFNITYGAEDPEDEIVFGACGTDCDIEGFATWDNSGVCELCQPQGCTECDTTGMCTACDISRGLSLITDVNDTSIVYCAPCEVLGCKLCEPDDNSQCKMCRKGFSLQVDEEGNSVCDRTCESGKFSEVQTLAATDAPALMTNLEHSVCSDCDAACTECKDAADKCLLCSDTTQTVQPDGSCSTGCPDGFFEIDRSCKKCGRNIATCTFDVATEVFTVTGCEDSYYIGPNEQFCVAEGKCGKGFFSNNSTGTCDECDLTTCSECVGTATTCTKCVDTTKLVSPADGSCVDTVDDVNCNTWEYKTSAGICKECHRSCSMTGGCTGEGNSKCLECDANFKIVSESTTTAGVTTYRCAAMCPVLSEEDTSGTVPVCKKCADESANTVFDFSTGTCVAPSSCPTGTVETTLDVLPAADFVDITSAVSANLTTINICAECSAKCETCLASNPMMCETCASNFFENTYSMTVNGTTVTVKKCEPKCQKGKWAATGSNVCDQDCVADCAMCSDDVSCDRCAQGFFLDLAASAPNLCVDQDGCPDSTYADFGTGACEACAGNCATCKGEADRCITCPSGKSMLMGKNMCVATCPQGTWQEATDVCMGCTDNILNCDPTDGSSPPEREVIECDPNCDGCFWTPSNCLNCQAGLFEAPYGRCLEECPASTYEVNMTAFTGCKECSKGCLRCENDIDMCPDEFSNTTSSGSSTSGSGSSASGTGSGTVTMSPKCLRCDKDLGFYLFRDHCVQECPHGTYPDKITGWCAQCDCSCGNGGCIDKHTCKQCTLPGMVLDPESGRCACDVTYTAAWADDWSSFTIEIDSPDVKFRDLETEYNDNMDEGYQRRMCTLGNEQGIVDYSNSTFDDSSPYIHIDRCGDYDLSAEELERIADEFMNSMFENSSMGGFGMGGFGMGDPFMGDMFDMDMGDDYDFGFDTDLDSTYDYGGMDYGDDVGYGMGFGEGFGMNCTDDDDDDSTDASGTTSSCNMTDFMGGFGGAGDYGTFEDFLMGYGGEYDLHIGDDYGICPAKVDSWSHMELERLGIMYPEDVYNYMARLGRTFGNIDDEDLEGSQTPLEYLRFSSQPMIDLCWLLFSDHALYMLDYPTCTVERVDGKTKITVEVGEFAYIEPDSVFRIKPNVFIDGCDWPALNRVEVTNGATPDTLDIGFNDQRQSVPVCEDLFLWVETEGGIGETDCEITYEGMTDSSDNPVETQAANDTIDAIGEDIEYSASYGDIHIYAHHLQALQAEGVTTIHIGAECSDSFGQHRFIYRSIGLATESTGIEKYGDVDSIPYSPWEGAYLFVDYIYSDCSSNQTMQYLNYTSTLQVFSGGSWVTATGENETIEDNWYIPPTLTAGNQYRVEIYVEVPGSATVNRTDHILIEMETLPPAMSIDGASAYMPASEVFAYNFTQDDFINVENYTDASLSFTCYNCETGGECLDQSGAAIDFNSYYDASTMSLTIPADTLAFETCFDVEISLFYNGELGWSNAFIETAPDGTTEVLEVAFDFNQGEVRDIYRRGKINCMPAIGEAPPSANITVDYFELYNLETWEPIVGSCAQLHGQKINYTIGCLQPNTDYLAECQLTYNKDDGTTVSGVGVSSFTTVSSLSISAGTVSPATGTQYDNYQLDIEVSYDKASRCSVGYNDTQTNTFKRSTKRYDFTANQVRTLTNVQIGVPETGTVSVNYMIHCKSKTTDDYAYFPLTLQMQAYTGTDLATQQQVQVETVVTSVTVVTWSSIPAVASTQASEVLSTIQSSGATTLGSATGAQATSVLDSCSQAISSFDASGNPDDMEIVIGAIVAIGPIIETSLTIDFFTTVMDALDGFLSGGSGGSGRRLNSAGDEIIAPTSEEDIKPHDAETCTQLAQAFSDMSKGVENGGMKPDEKDKAKKKLIILNDRLIKACVHNLGEGDTFQFPSREIFVYVEKATMDATSLGQEMTYAFDCPCSDAYVFEADSSSADASSASTTGTRFESISDFTSSDKSCKVSIPAYNDLPTDITKCSSLAIAVVSTRAMCPGSDKPDEASTDSTTTSPTAIDAALLADSELEQTFSSTEGTCQTSQFADMQCNGPSMDVSYYCVKDTRAGSTGRRKVERVKIPQFKNDKTISYYMNCTSSDDDTSASSETQAVFYNEENGQSSCAGTTYDADTGTVTSAHATSFGLAKVAKSGSGHDFGERVYANFVLYFVLIIDFYFIAVFIYSLLAKKDKEVSQIGDSSKAEPEKLPGKPENMDASFHERRSNDAINNTRGENDLCQKGFCTRMKIGFMLKYRLITPFTTPHRHLSILNRGIINVLVLYFIWVFSGIILDGIEDVAGSYCTSIVVCFIVARLFTFVLEILHYNRANNLFTYLSWGIAFCIGATLHVAVFLLTDAMGKEFDDWAVLVVIVYVIDLIVWELISLLAQVFIATKLAADPNNFSGKRKFMEKLVTQPLLSKFMDA